MHEELGPKGFTPITVALDTGPEAARPFIDRAAPTHPALIDPEHQVADLFNMINVPTMVWIDEDGRIVRPNDQQFGTDMFVQLTGRPSGPFLAALRAWVNEGRGALAPDSWKARTRCGPTGALAATSTVNLPLFVAALKTRPRSVTIWRAQLSMTP